MNKEISVAERFHFGAKEIMDMDAYTLLYWYNAAVALHKQEADALRGR